MNYLIIALHIVLVCLLLRLCYTDVRDRVISNRVVALLFFIVVPLSLLQYQSIFFVPALVALVVGFVGSMQTCLNVSTWVLMSELFPLRVRAVGMGLSAFCGWMMNGLLSLVFPVILGALGLTGSFFGFMVVNVLIAVLMWRNLPETRGKTLEDVEAGVISGAAYPFKK